MYLVVKGIVVEEWDSKILVIALDFLGRALLELEYLEVVVNCILQEAVCLAALTCNLLHINIQLYRVIMMQKTYHSNHRHWALIMQAIFLAGFLPHHLGPLCLSSFRREGVSSQDKTGIFVHSLKQHFLNTTLVICSLRFGAWIISLAKRCLQKLGIRVRLWQWFSICSWMGQWWCCETGWWWCCEMW